MRNRKAQKSSKKKLAEKRAARTKPRRAFRTSDIERLANRAARKLRKLVRRRGTAATNDVARARGAQLARALARKCRLAPDRDEALYFNEVMRDVADQLTGRETEIN